MWDSKQYSLTVTITICHLKLHNGKNKCKSCTTKKTNDYVWETT